MKKTNSGFKVHNVAVIAALLAALLFVGSTFAWYFTAAKLDMGSVSGSVSFLANYFESGDGSAEHPYEIAKPEQLYNLAWLQYLGAFNQTSDPEFTPFHFYISAELDMSTFVLPPIGTQDNPFIGYLDGQGHTVSNLTVANVTTEDVNEAAKIYDLPQNVKYLEGTNVSGVEIIGFMGVVGTYNGTTATYDSQTLALKNITLQNLTVNTQTDNALIGLAAGYVNGPMENVAVNGGTITIKSGTAPVDATNMTSNMSDYSLVGYCTDAYKIMAKQPDEVVQHYILATVPVLINKTMSQLVQGHDNTWGGSIDMKSMYERLLRLFGNSSHISYTSAQTVTYLDGVEVSASNTNSYAMSGSAYYSNMTYDTSTSVTYNEDDSTDQNNKYMCLDGDRAYEKVITPIYQFTGFKIKSNGYYLNASTNGISSGTAANTATVWLYDETNHRIYTYINNSVNPYYLRYDGSALSVSQSNATNWFFGDDGCLYYNSANSGYALHCYNGSWMVTAGTGGTVTNMDYFYIRVGTGNDRYLISNGNNSDASLGTKANATRWYGYVDGSSATEYCRVYGNTNLYLTRTRVWLTNHNAYVTNSTDGAYYFYTTGGNTYLYNGSYYIRYNNGLTATNNSSNRTAITIERDTQTVADFGSKVIDRSETGITQYIGNTISDNSYKTPSTYFPLTVVDQEGGNYAVAEKNTGYITSGSVDTSGTGDLRVSYFYMSNLFRSMGITEPNSLSNAFSNYINNANAVTYDDTKLQVVTRTANSNGLVRIKDSHNSSTIGTRNSRMPATTMTPEDLGFKKYDQARDNLQRTFEQSLQDSNRIYGMHYVQAKVDINRLVTIPHAVINQVEYDNYTVPQDCVDFNLKENGFINFFAGTYYVNRTQSGNTYVLNTSASNNSFFSLHQIFRDDNQNITEILEISKIYKRTSDADGDGSYVYKYTNNKYSKMTLDDQGIPHYAIVDSAASATSDNLMFDLDWLTNPLEGSTLTWDSTKYILCAVYYFEIPANEGEYALGSFEGKNGAYLFYLDIAANGLITSEEAWVATTEDVKVTETRTNRFGIPAGVDFGPVTPVGDPDAVAALTGSGSVTYSRSGNVVTGTGSGGITQTVNFLRKENNTSTSYVKDGTTVTADSIHLTQYNETDWLDAGQTQPAFDTYGVDHQIVEKHLTVRVYDVGRIDDSFTLAYTYEKDGIADETDDPVLIRYADPLIYMVQYDPSKTSAPTVESVENGFKGTIFIGTMGDDATLTQAYPTGTNKTMKPSSKEVKIQVHGAEELFRVYGDPDATIGCTYSSTLNTSTGEQDFTYNVTGTDLEEPIVHSDTSGCTVTSTSTTAATLTWTLEAPTDTRSRGASNGKKSVRSSGAKGVTDGKATKGDNTETVTGKDAKAALEKGEKGDASDATEQKEVFRKEEEKIIVQNGSRVERSDEEHVTRYFEYFPDAEDAVDGWILVLEVYDEGYKIPIVEAEPTEDEIEEDEEAGEETGEAEDTEEGSEAGEGAEGSADENTEEGSEVTETGEAAEGAGETEGEEGTEGEKEPEGTEAQAGAEGGEAGEGTEGTEAQDGAEGNEGTEAGDSTEVQDGATGSETQEGTESGEGTEAQAGAENGEGTEAEAGVQGIEATTENKDTEELLGSETQDATEGQEPNS